MKVFLVIFFNIIKMSDFLCTNQTHSKSETTAALILARGGSKGIPMKNMATINGISLIGRAIDTIAVSGVFKNIWVSTDSIEIATEARKFGALVHERPSRLAQDNTSSIDAVKEFMSVHKEFRSVFLFQCTSVFLNTPYILKAYELSKTSECVFSVTRTFQLRWSLENTTNKVNALNFDPKHRPRRQDWSGELVETGMFYFATRELIEQNSFQNNNCRVVEVFKKHALEVDTIEDMRLAEILILNNEDYCKC